MADRKIVHFDIPFSDSDASREFYTGLFGWAFEHNEDFDYTMFSDNAGGGGGLIEVGDTTKPGNIMIYIGSDDVASDLAKAKELGGTIISEKQVIEGFGVMGVFADPAGNAIGLWKDDRD